MIDTEFIRILVFLLPGFIGASIFHYINRRPKPDILTRTVHALILTIAANQSALWLANCLGLAIEQSVDGPTTSMIHIALNPLFFLATGIASLFGLIGSLLTNHDIIHRVLRSINLSDASAYISVTQASFARNSECYAMIYLTLNRRLWGFVYEYPDQDTGGHLYVEDAAWLDDEDTLHPVIGEGILVKSETVEFVQFVPLQPGSTDDETA